MGKSKTNGWTPQRRAKQAEAIQRWRPWEKSTGPRTEEGKAISSLNAYRGGGPLPDVRSGDDDSWMDLVGLTDWTSALPETDTAALWETEAGLAMESQRGAASDPSDSAKDDPEEEPQ